MGQRRIMPYIKIWKQDSSIDYPIIEPAKVQRDILDNTYNKIGYSCTPITLANQHGWWFLLPQDVVIEWNGIRDGLDGEDPNNIRIIEGEYYNGFRIATTESGVGQLTFLLNCSIETDSDHYTIVSGPPNFFHEDAKPLEVVWRSDFFNYHEVSFNWIITTKDKRITFPKGMPIAFIKNYPKDLLNNTDILVSNLSDNPQLKEDTRNYVLQRNEWFKDKDQYSFRYWYRRAIGPRYKKMTNSPISINLKQSNIDK
jgi:hypothetical protein